MRRKSESDERTSLQFPMVEVGAEQGVPTVKDPGALVAVKPQTAGPTIKYLGIAPVPGEEGHLKPDMWFDNTFGGLTSVVDPI